MTGHDMPTLGERLDAAARAIAERHQMRYQWATSLIPVLRRAARLSESPGDRFERHEAPAGPQLPVSAAEAERTGWPAPARGSRPCPAPGSADGTAAAARWRGLKPGRGTAGRCPRGADGRSGTGSRAATRADGRRRRLPQPGQPG